MEIENDQSQNPKNPTDRRSITSRENGKNGGVKTDTGKAITRMNAIKHGILSKFQTKFDWVSVTDIFDELSEEYECETFQQRFLLEQLAVSYVRLNRCMRFETEFLREELESVENEEFVGWIESKHFSKKVLVNENEKALLSISTLTTLKNIFSSYEPRVMGQIIKLLEILEIHRKRDSRGI